MQRDSIIKLAIVGTAACAAVFALTNLEVQTTNLQQVDQEFAQYCAIYGKDYKDSNEYARRQNLFNEKKAIFAMHNSNNENTFVVGVN